VYSLSKKFNEELAEVYSKIYKLNLVGFRFFTVYAEWGRPDMFYLNYFKSILIKHQVFNICSNRHVNLMKFIGVMNKISKKNAKLKKLMLLKHMETIQVY